MVPKIVTHCPVCGSLVRPYTDSVPVHFAKVADQRPCSGSYMSIPSDLMDQTKQEKMMRHLIEPSGEEFDELCDNVQRLISDSIVKHEDAGLRIRRIVCAVLDGRHHQQMAEIEQEISRRAEEIRYSEELDVMITDAHRAIAVVNAELGSVKP